MTTSNKPGLFKPQPAIKVRPHDSRSAATSPSTHHYRCDFHSHCRLARTSQPPSRSLYLSNLASNPPRSNRLYLLVSRKYSHPLPPTKSSSIVENFLANGDMASHSPTDTAMAIPGRNHRIASRDHPSHVVSVVDLDRPHPGGVRGCHEQSAGQTRPPGNKMSARRVAGAAKTRTGPRV